MVSLKLTPFIGDGNIKHRVACVFPVRLKLTPFIGDGNCSISSLDPSELICLKLTPFIGDGNVFGLSSLRVSGFSKFKTNPVYRGRKPKNELF